MPLRPEWAEGFRNPKYFNVGMLVYIPFKHEGVLKGLRCKVTGAAGDCAWVENQKHGVERFVSLDDCAITDEQFNQQNECIIEATKVFQRV